MDNSLVEALDESWWKIIAIIATTAFATIAVKITFKFDFNEWLKQRREAKQEQKRIRIVEKCRHGWTLYHSSPHSQCTNCLAFISTSILLTARELGTKPAPIILGESYSIAVKPSKGDIFVNSYIGNTE